MAALARVPSFSFAHCHLFIRKRCTYDAQCCGFTITDIHTTLTGKTSMSRTPALPRVQFEVAKTIISDIEELGFRVKGFNLLLALDKCLPQERKTLQAEVALSYPIFNGFPILLCFKLCPRLTCIGRPSIAKKPHFYDVQFCIIPVTFSQKNCFLPKQDQGMVYSHIRVVSMWWY